MRNWDTGEKQGTSVDIDADAIGHDLLLRHDDVPIRTSRGSAGSSSTTESWATAETGRRRVGRARRRAGRLERVRSDDRADGRDDRRRHRPRRARTRGRGDAVLRRRDERSGWRALDSDQCPATPSVRRDAPRRGRATCCVGLWLALALTGLLGPRRHRIGRTDTVVDGRGRRVPVVLAVIDPGRRADARTRRHRRREPARCSRRSSRRSGRRPSSVAGRAYIDALVAAGFDKAAMQVTPDQTTVGNPAESIQFSVRWGRSA